MGLYFLNSGLLKCFVIGVNGNILVLVFAVEDWRLYLESLMLVFGRYYHQVLDVLQSRAELQKQEMCDFHKRKWVKMNAQIANQGSVMSRKSFSGGGPPRYQLQVVSERRIQAYCRACSPFKLLSSSQSVHKHSFSPADTHGTV